MKINVGRLDQLIRIIFSLGLVYVGLIDEGIIADPLSSNIIGYFGVIMLFVAVVRFCPLYSIVGFNTSCDRKKAEKD